MKTLIAFHLTLLSIYIAVVILVHSSLLSESQEARAEQLEIRAMELQCVELARTHCLPDRDSQAEAILACLNGVDIGIESFAECETER